MPHQLVAVYHSFTGLTTAIPSRYSRIRYVDMIQYRKCKHSKSTTTRWERSMAEPPTRRSKKELYGFVSIPVLHYNRTGKGVFL